MCASNGMSKSERKHIPLIQRTSNTSNNERDYILFLCRSSPQRTCERLEPYAGKLACTVLRGRGCSNALLLPDFKGRQFPPDIILWAVRWYCRYPLAYRMLEEMLKERGVEVNHATIARWVQVYGPEI